MKSVWNWIEYNRFVVIGFALALIIYVGGIGCQPETESPLQPDKYVTESQLGIELKSWQSQQEVMVAKFEAAGADLQKQKEDINKLQDLLLSLATGKIGDVQSLLAILVGGGGLGAIVDNIRKRGVIAGLKRNK